MTADAEKVYSGTLEYLYSQIPLDKLRLTDSVSEKESEKSIVKCSHDMFVEINEKISAQFTSTGFAIHIKVNGMSMSKTTFLVDQIFGFSCRTTLRSLTIASFRTKRHPIFPCRLASCRDMAVQTTLPYGSLKWMRPSTFRTLNTPR